MSRRRRNQDDAELDDRNVRRRVAAAAPAEPREERFLLRDEDQEAYGVKLESAENIMTWVLMPSYHVHEQFIRNFAALVFGAVSGPDAFQASLINRVRYVFVPGRSQMTHLDFLNLIESPIERKQLLARSARVEIQVCFEGVQGLRGEWMPWLALKRDRGVFVLLADRDFQENEVVSVFCGGRLWTSDLAYNDDARAYEFDVPMTEYSLVCRAPDARLIVVDATPCHLLFAAQFILATNSLHEINCQCDDLGIMSTTRPVRRNEKLCMAFRGSG
jgi:hypothetical protein